MLLEVDDARTHSQPACRTSRMEPVAFAGCFGWYHAPARRTYGNTAVLLCPGLGADGATGHRSFRLLAEELSAIGYPTLRFDYLGTGDSCDADGAEPWAMWKSSISSALSRLATLSGTQRFVLIGLRIGATLAAEVAGCRSDVAGLVMLAPILRGKSYLSQLAVEARLREPSSATGTIEITLGDSILGSETQAHLRQVDLSRNCPDPGCRVTFYVRERTPALAACVQAWDAQNVEIRCRDFDGLEAFMRPTHLADEAAADFSDIVRWLQSVATSELPTQDRVQTDSAVLPIYSGLQPPGCVEAALRFGEDDHLCGILCQPKENIAANSIVVIVNSSGNPHHGFARFSVEVARYLATRGLASLRIDFGGLGDSRTSAANDGPTHVFEVDRTHDVSAALDALQALGYRHFAAHGVCSGAYHALQAGFADARIGTLLLLNLPWFTLRHEKGGPASFASGIMSELMNRATSIQIMFAEGDRGLKEFERHFGVAGADLPDASLQAVEIVAGWDHDLTSRSMRIDACHRIGRFLQLDYKPVIRHPLTPADDGRQLSSAT